MTQQPNQPDRTDSARDHDDHELIEGSEPTPSAQGSSGGGLQRDIGNRADEAEAMNPDAGITRVRKGDDPDRPVAGRDDDQGAQDR